MTEFPEHRVCARCGRLLRSEKARQYGYGEHCRRKVYRAVKVLYMSGNKQAYDAAVNLVQASARPIKAGRVWSIWGKTENYMASPNTCNCPGAMYRPTANSCYHSVVAAVLAA